MGCSNSTILIPEPKVVIETITLNNEISTTTETIHRVSWAERRNSQREKDFIIQTHHRDAKIQLENAITYKSYINSKCPVCNAEGPDGSNRYYGFYLVVDAIITKATCKKCNIKFTFQHFGVVKTEEELFNAFLKEIYS
jgi:hypothetical protein